MGAATKKTAQIVEAICERIAQGEPLRKIVKSEGMPHEVTVFRWLEKDEEFRAQYALARERQADFYADQCIEIADDGRNDTYELDDGSQHVAHDHIQRSRLRVDTRKWYASKLYPKKYGDRNTTELTGEGGGAVKFVVELVKAKE